MIPGVDGFVGWVVWHLPEVFELEILYVRARLESWLCGEGDYLRELLDTAVSLHVC